MVGLNGLRCLFQPQRICDSLTLWEAQRVERVKSGGAVSVLQHWLGAVGFSACWECHVGILCTARVPGE